MELPCVLCGSNEKNDLIFGELSLHEGNMMHRNCLVLCLGKHLRNKNHTFRLVNFLRKGILTQKNRFAVAKCSYCHELGANLSCSHQGCKRSFHTKCGIENMCVFKYGGRYDSYCAQHVPHHRNHPGPDENCVLCLAAIVPEGKTFKPALAFQAPCCHNGWFHRDCAQDYANATIYNFKCPLCRDENRFDEVAMFGVFIPKWRYALPKPPIALVSRLSRAMRQRIARLVGPRIINTPPVQHTDRAPRNRVTRP